MSIGFANGAGLRETLERAIAGADRDNEVSLSAPQRAMLFKILDFGTVRVSEVMVPRADVVAISEEQPVGALLRLFANEGHSRIPVFGTSLDDPLGMVHIKDVMAWAQREVERARSNGTAAPAEASEIVDFACLDLGRSIAETGLRREILFVPPSMPAVDLLAKMRACRIHLALVVDEFGGTDGLVSIEDLVEEIVGDIADEHDETEVPFAPAAGGAFEVSARAPIAEVEQVLGVPLALAESAGGVDTLGGLILAMNGYVPKRGARIAHPSGITFEILEATPRRIQKVRVLKPKALPAPNGDRAPALLLTPPPVHGSDARAA